MYVGQCIDLSKHNCRTIDNTRGPSYITIYQLIVTFLFLRSLMRMPSVSILQLSSRFAIRWKNPLRPAEVLLSTHPPGATNLDNAVLKHNRV